MDDMALSPINLIANVPDDDLEALRVAAFNAQEAATRCEKRATDIFSTRNSDATPGLVNPFSLSSSPPWARLQLDSIESTVEDLHSEHAKPSRADLNIEKQEELEKVQDNQEEAHKKLEQVNDKSSQQGSSTASDLIEAIGDSGLGESLSDTEASTQQASIPGILSRSRSNEIASNHKPIANADAQSHNDQLRQPDEKFELSSASCVSPLSESSKISTLARIKTPQLYTNSDHPAPAQQVPEEVHSPSLVLIFKLAGKPDVVSLVRKEKPRPLINAKHSTNDQQDGTIRRGRGRPRKTAVSDGQGSRAILNSAPNPGKLRAAVKRTIPGGMDGETAQGKIHGIFQQPKLIKRRPKKFPSVLQSMPVLYQSVYAPTAHSFGKSPISAPISSQRRTKSSSNLKSGLDNLDNGSPNRSMVHCQYIPGMSSANNNSFVKAFQKSISPIIKSVAQNYNNVLPEENIFSICKEVTDELVTKDFQASMRACSYDLNDEQLTKIRTYVKASFGQRVSIPNLDREEPTLDQKSNSVFPRFLSDPAGFLPSQTTDLAHTLDDLSLLGPGKMIESAVPNLLLSNPLFEKTVSLHQSMKNHVHGLEANVNDLSIATESPKTTSIGKTFSCEQRALNIIYSLDPKIATRSVLSPGSNQISKKFTENAAKHKVANVSRTGVSVSLSKASLDCSKLQATSLTSNHKARHHYSKTSASLIAMQQEQNGWNKRAPIQSEGPTPSTLKYVQQNIRVNSLSQATGHSVESNIYSDIEDQSGTEDGEKLLASWLSMHPDKNRSCKVPKSAVISNDVLSSNNTTSSSSSAFSKNGRMSTTGVISSHVLSDVEFQNNKSKPTRKASSSLASSTSIARSVDDLDPTDHSEKVHRQPSCKSLSPQLAGDLDFEDNPYDLGSTDFEFQSDTTMRRSKRLTSQRDSFRVAIFKGKLSTNLDPYLEKSIGDIVLKAPYVQKPYNNQDRNVIKHTDGHGSLKHIDFSDEECEEISKVLLTLFGPIPASIVRMKLRDQLHFRVQNLSYDDVSAVIKQAHLDSNSVLQSRKRKSIRAFLSDLAKSVPDQPKLTRVEVQIIDPVYQPERSTASVLRKRELGLGFQRNRNLQSELRLRVSENISPWRSWKGASGDIVACAWAPNSFNYAVGAVAPDNDEDLQYNRPRNLLYGNLNANTLEELPDHRIDRPKPEMIASGPNSTQAVYDACDPMIYKTVSSLQFSQDGYNLYSASHDMKVKVWDVSSNKISCVETLDHCSTVIDLDVANQFETLFATASKTIDGAVRIYHPNLDSSGDRRFSSMCLTSPRAKEKPLWELYPGCVRWGKTTNTGHLLLAGFMQWGDLSKDSGREGQICLWDAYSGKDLKVTPGSQSVFTATWHPLFDMFATGGGFSRGRPLNHRDTRSVVRTWDIRTTGLARDAVEFECPACDMQDITFNPLFPYIVTAGCTDSATYVWDFRMPDEVLLKLEHGRPLLDWDHTKPRDETDTGVMMTLWGMEGSRFYTGSSDGIVKCWDTSRAPEDAFIRNVADLGAGVQSGAFSPDFSHLLVGDADGGVHVLTSAPADGGYDNSSDSNINFIAAHETKEVADDPGNEGVLAATKLLESGELLLDKKYGVGKGPHYKGPFASYARLENTDCLVSHLLPEFEAMQPFSKNGYERPEMANKIQGMIEERKLHIASQQKNEKAESDPKSKNCRVKTKKRPKYSPSSSNPNIKRSRNRDEAFVPIKKPKFDIIDLSSPPHDGLTSPHPLTIIDMTMISESSRERPIELDSDSDFEVEDNVIPEWEMLEENHWWPRWDEEVFRRLGVGSKNRG